MSGIVPFAVLAATVNALRGATLVGDFVIEAPLDEVEDVLVQHEGRPLITVLVGQEDATHQGLALLRAETKLHLSIQAFLPESMEVEVGGEAVRLDTRGKGIEVVLSTITRQIHFALLASDAPWSQLWRKLVVKAPETSAQSYLLLLKNTRIAAREYEITCETCYEPDFGQPPVGIWADFVALLREVEDYGDPVADLIAAQIEGEPGLPSWRAVQASLGLTEVGIGAGTGLGPFRDAADPATGEAPLMKTGVLDDEDRGVERTIVDGSLAPYEVPPEAGP